MAAFEQKKSIRFTNALAGFEKVVEALEKFIFEEQEFIRNSISQWVESDEAKSRIEGEVSSLYDESRFLLCSNMVSEVEISTSMEEIMTSSIFKNYEDTFQIPIKLRRNEEFDNFARYVKSMLYRESLDVIIVQVNKKVAQKYKESLIYDRSVLERRRLHEKILLDDYVDILTISDHERIRIIIDICDHLSKPVLDTPDNEVLSNQASSSSSLLTERRAFQIASHNVQERKLNGISTFISSFECLHGKDKLIRKDLTALMLHEQTEREHFQQILKFVLSELNSFEGESDEITKATTNSLNCVAVCLQEVSMSVIEKLQHHLCQATYLIHSSGATSQEALSSDVKCEAITCIVTSKVDDCIKLPDVSVDYVQTSQTSQSIKTRHFAMVYFNSFKIAVVSIHVRHSTHTKNRPKFEAQDSTNQFECLNENVNCSLKAIAERYQLLRANQSSASSEDLPFINGCTNIEGIIVVGDFNAYITAWDNTIVKCDGTEEAFRVTARAPDCITAYGGQGCLHAIDGAVWMHYVPSSSTPLPVKVSVSIIE